jgi:hypothetical protein
VSLFGKVFKTPPKPPQEQNSGDKKSTGGQGTEGMGSGLDIGHGDGRTDGAGCC